MEDFVIVKDISFYDERLESLLEDLRKCYSSQQQNFAELCKTIYSIWSYCKNSYFKSKDNDYYNSYKLLEKFGFNKKAISRYKQCYEKFIDIKSCTVYESYNGFTSSKLFELLPLSKDTIDRLIDNKVITPTMTVKEIRKYVKNITSGTQPETVIEESMEINEEEIPMAYDPKKEYEYSYFESKTKNQLLNIVWELQKEYQKLKKKEKTSK